MRVTAAEASTHEKVEVAMAEFEHELPAWPDAASPEDRQMQIAKHAKALAELSRNAVASVRGMR